MSIEDSAEELRADFLHLQRVIAPWLAPTPLIQLLCYFVMPLIVIALCVGIAGSLRQRLPRGYAVLTGGR